MRDEPEVTVLVARRERLGAFEFAAPQLG